MVDVGPVAVGETAADDADLAVFVQRLAAAGTDQAGSRARDLILDAVRRGAAPAGLRRLAEGLAASVGEFPPAQRRPSDDADSVVAAMGDTPLAVLDGFGSDGVAAAVAALVADGRRVIVTAAEARDLDAVRSDLPGAVADRSLDRLPDLPARELRQLRALLATSTPARRDRRDQQIPPPAAFPDPAEVAELCRQATRPTRAGSAGLVAGVLAGSDRDRVGAVTSVARCVDASVGALRARGREDWAWSLLADLVHSRHRATLDELLGATAQATAATERCRSGEEVSVADPLPDHAITALSRYVEFLTSGGRSRQFFRSAAQREVQPVLEKVRVGGRVPVTAEEVALVLDHLELRSRHTAIAAGCAEIGAAPPRDDTELTDLVDGLTRVAAAARSVGALRHDVLFLHPQSPVAVPDLDTVEEIASAILEYAEFGSPVDAATALDRSAMLLATQAPAAATAPEHHSAVVALSGRDAPGYAVAVESLDAARREVADERRTTDLLARLGSAAPRLADAWEHADGHAPYGLAAFVPVEQLLDALPSADSADVLVVLGAEALGVERLLLTAAAPRLVAVTAPGSDPQDSPTMLSVLHRAGAAVIRGKTGPAGRVVRFTSPREVARVGDAARQAGA